MFKKIVGPVLGLMLVSQVYSALDMVPTALTVVLVDSLSNPEMDSVTLSLSVMVKGGATKSRAAWTSSEISIEGVVKMRGGVDSGQVFAANTNYTYKIGTWVDKKPFSIIGYVDPEGVLGETLIDGANNALVKTYRFHKPVKHDTLYTGKNCLPPPRKDP
jgi:hypothetical protein